MSPDPGPEPTSNTEHYPADTDPIAAVHVRAAVRADVKAAARELLEYTRSLNADLTDDEIRDAAHGLADPDRSDAVAPPHPGTEHVCVTAGMRPPEPTGTKSIHAAIAHDACVNLVADHISDLGMDTIEHAAAHGTHVHAASDGIILSPNGDDGLSNAATRCVSRLTGDATDGRALLEGVPHTAGRPPLGCTSDAGTLRPADTYPDVCRVVQRVADGDTSKAAAADALGCTRKTIGNALDRPELYQLE